MKKIAFIYIFIIFFSDIHAQDIDSYDVTKEFKDVAAQGLAKVSPSTKQWFANMAKQHPPGSFNTAWAKERLFQKFTLEEMNKMGDLFVAMMAYQKMLNKEAREDRKIDRTDMKHELDARANKLETDKIKIEQQKKEAEERYNNSMESAEIEMIMGIVSASAASASAMQTQNNGTNLPASLVKVDSSKYKQQRLNLQDQKLQLQQANADKAEENKKARLDHIKAQKDAFRKYLDQLEEMNRHTQI